MSVKLLTEHHLKCLKLKGGYTGSSESTFAKMPHCWKSHVTAHFVLYLPFLLVIIKFAAMTLSMGIFMGRKLHKQSRLFDSL